MEWISVKERLPDKGADVLMWFESNMTVGFWHDTDEGHTYWCAFTDEGYYTDCDSEPTYWMSLPESPNERRDCEADVEEYAEMTIEAAIKHCEEVSRRSPCTPCEREHMRLAAWLTELVSLRAQQKQLNEPLTLEELREMNGEPVWVQDLLISRCSAWHFAIKHDGEIRLFDAVAFGRQVVGYNATTGENYRKTWLAYRRKPEQEKVVMNSERITASPESPPQCDFCTNPMKNLTGPVQGCDGNCQFEDGVPPNITNSGLAAPSEDWEAQLLRDLARRGVSYQDAQAALDIIRQLKQKEKEGTIHGERI